MSQNSAQITKMLQELAAGQDGPEELAQAVYDELHKIARAYMRQERREHTLQATALVSEAYIRIFQGKPVQWESRSHFYRFAASVMRHVLIDHARKGSAAKRGDRPVRLSLDEEMDAGNEIPSESGAPDVLSLDRALSKLAELDARLAQVVELKYFAALDLERIAETLDCSVGTVKRDWTKAKMWLARELKEQDE